MCRLKCYHNRRIERKKFLTMINAKFFALFVILLALGSGGFAQIQNKVGANPVAEATRFMPLADVKEGMYGIARTVFKGRKSEQFNVEILGIVPGGVGPKQDMIVGRISGGGADRTSVFAGMSGSPVYIDGKLVGAISYSFPFSKEPICGITPIEQMIAIFEQKPGGKTKAIEPRAVSFAELASTNWQANFPKTSGAANSLLSGISSNSLLMTVAGQSFQPIATPVTFTGFSQETLNLFGPQLLQAGLMPVSAVGGSAAMTPLKKAKRLCLAAIRFRCS